jgi:hypothetical protein
MRGRTVGAIVFTTALAFASIFACSDGPTVVPPSAIAIPGARAPISPPPSFSGPDLASRCPGFDAPTLGSPCSPQPTRLGTSSSSGSASSSSGTSSGGVPPSILQGTACEYGHDLDPSCNAVFRCVGTGWSRDTQRSPCFERCPSTIDDIVAGSVCTDRSMGCSYLRGTCACVADVADAGTDAGGAGPGHWLCAPPPSAGCPPQRPGLGSDCVIDMTCDYGSSLLRRDLTFACVNGRWVQTDSQITR